MQYTSTRNNTITVTAAQAIAQGISVEGGLFVPCSIPKLTAEDFSALQGMAYSERATYVLSRFLTDFTPAEVKECTDAAYGKQFDTPAVAPINSVDDTHNVLELWHGPTCAFKDMALQILPHLMRVSTAKTAAGETVILVATSGDTGKAALEGFRDAAGTRILVFYPAEGVSEMQRLQMITQEGANVGVCAIRGNFDDAQTGVKTLFTDPTMQEYLEENGMRFSSANSINWGRLVPQIVYYISAYVDMVAQGKLKKGELMNVVVPTGNFGNILAAYYAREMGTPIAKLICASNRNRVLTDFFATGTYNTAREFYTTTSPSMDILVSSNLERLLYHLIGEDSGAIADMMTALREKKQYTVPTAVKEQMDALFAAGCATDDEVAATIKAVFDKTGYLLDTHTAVAFHVYDAYRTASGDVTPTVIASTANPYKFTPAILEALGKDIAGDPFCLQAALHAATNEPVPAPLAGLGDKAIRFTDICDGDVASMRQMVCGMLELD